LKYIHSAGVIFYTLKPASILVNSDCTIKLSDFGLCRSCTQRNDQLIIPLAESDSLPLIVTIGYRAPELLLESDHYGPKLDVWGVGCILAELLLRKPLFDFEQPSGDETIEQLRRIFDVLGTPSLEDIQCMGTPTSRKFVLSMPFQARPPWNVLFTNANPQALDLLERMLTFNPDRRATVEQCLEHVYLAEFHEPIDEPTCTTPIDFSFEQAPSDINHLRELLYEEALDYFHEKVPPCIL